MCASLYLYECVYACLRACACVNGWVCLFVNSKEIYNYVYVALACVGLKAGEHCLRYEHLARKFNEHGIFAAAHDHG